MAYTHNYELKVNGYTFEGEVEVSNAGIVAYTEPSDPAMPQKTRDCVKKILDILGSLPTTYTNLEKFELVIKS